PHRLRGIIHRYSEHITFPVRMPKPDEEGDTPDEAQEQTSSAAEFEVVNQATALWTRPRKEITQQEYDEFYKQICFDFEPPLLHLHSRVEGKQEYTSLLYVPSRAPFDLWDRDRRHGVKLYVKRVFIMDDAEQLMPAYLRFVRGVIDSDDLPLNVSREILQGNRLVDSIRAGCTRKVLDALSEMAEQDAEKYAKFWTTFGRVIKEGVVEDPANRERIAALLRFVTTDTGPDGMTSLQTYIENMPEGQEKIYYLTADSYAAAAESPHLEIFRQRNIEVLLLSDPIDEWVVDGLAEFEGKSLQSVAKGELDIDNLGDDDARDAPTAGETSELTERLQGVLEDRVESVRVTRRLTQSPVCLVVGEHAMSKHLERIMQAAGQNLPGSKPILEVNAEHPLVQRAAEEKDDERFADWAALLLDQALLSEGGQLDNPAAFLRRVNRFLTERQEEARIILPS
ncbi:MAG: molecular chaperone HtpG, partial [Pseudomonadota bacterium]|nr:molecular chaperone HtpG [Pseudomonadota bacterium]